MPPSGKFHSEGLLTGFFINELVARIVQGQYASALTLAQDRIEFVEQRIALVRVSSGYDHG